MSPRLSRISVLEQVPLFEGGDVRQTLGDLVRLGRGLEESGYHRLWLAEHHSTGSFLSSAPDLHMMHILDATDRIRVGSGGVMAMHYGSLQMAERFATLATLHPGRVDMGLGRAPGGDMRAAAALNQGRVIDPDAINALIEETVALLRDELPATHPYASVEVRPLPCWWSRVVRGWASRCGHDVLPLYVDDPGGVVTRGGRAPVTADKGNDPLRVRSSVTWVRDRSSTGWSSPT